MKKAISKKHLFLILLFSFLVGDFFSQISANAGMGTLNGFGAKKTFFGFNLGLEYPKSNQTTIYGRIAYYIPRNNEQSTNGFVEAKDPFTTVPFSLARNYIVSTGYLTVEGGNRFYIINGYDNGFSIYGGSTILVCVNKIKRKFDVWKYSNNESDYEMNDKGTILNLGVGLQGGLKYTFPSIGTFFCDLSVNYIIINQFSNVMVLESTNYPFNSAMLFTFNLGFRKDFY